MRTRALLLRRTRRSHFSRTDHGLAAHGIERWRLTVATLCLTRAIPPERAAQRPCYGAGEVTTVTDDEVVSKPKTPEACETLAGNAEARGNPELARKARRRAVELRALAHNATTDVERQALEAVYAYERARSTGGRRFRATRMWQVIARRGVIQAVEHMVTQSTESVGYRTLAAMGFHKMSFEAVVSRHPEAFSSEAVDASRRRLAEWGFDTVGEE